MLAAPAAANAAPGMTVTDATPMTAVKENGKKVKEKVGDTKIKAKVK